jgi:hypothetical protein
MHLTEPVRFLVLFLGYYLHVVEKKDQ